jgi:hypothetical protein
LDLKSLYCCRVNPTAGKLGLAVQLAFYKQYARFPEDESDLAPAVIAHLADQIGVSAVLLDDYEWGAGRDGGIDN